MTRFNRQGHYRKNANGTVSWVQAHSVSRTDWKTGDGTLRRNDPAVFLSTPAHGYSPTTISPRSTHPVEPMSIDIWSHRHITAHNARCPVCGQSVFFYRNEHGSAVFFDELGPPWAKHPCTTGELTALFLPSAAPPKPATPQWQMQGWQPLRSAQVFELELGGYGVQGYSGGELRRLLLADMSAALADEIRSSGKAIWHYQIAERSSKPSQVGVFTPSEQFHVFSLESIDAQKHGAVTAPAEYATKAQPLSGRFDPAIAAHFSGHHFVAKPNATCPVCQREVYVYHYHHHHPTSGLLVLDEEGPPWAEHDCAVSTLPWKQAGWNRLVFGEFHQTPHAEISTTDQSQRPSVVHKLLKLVFGRFRPSEDLDIRIAGYSQGRSVVLRLLNIDEHHAQKLLAATITYYHYRENDDGSLVLGAYMPGEPFLQWQAAWIY